MHARMHTHTHTHITHTHHTHITHAHITHITLTHHTRTHHTHHTHTSHTHTHLDIHCSALHAVGIPTIKWCGTEGDCNVLVMELLGPSLEDLFNFCGCRFSLKTVLLLANQLVSTHTATPTFTHYTRTYVHTLYNSLLIEQKHFSENTTTIW